MLRILVVTNGWGIRNIGGGEYHILRVLQRWSKECKVSVIIPKSGYISSDSMLSKRCTIYLSSQEKEISNVTIEAIFYLRRILKSSFFRLKQNPEIIVSSSHLLYDVLPAFILRLRVKSKLVVYIHGLFLRDDTKGLWRSIATLSEKISLFLCKKADLIYVVNPSIKDKLTARGFQRNKVVVTGNGVEHDLIDPTKQNDKRFDGCFCGRLVEKKGVYDLIDIWETVLRCFPESKLVIIGNGSAYNELSNLIKNKALDKKIILTGFITEEQKKSTLKSSKVFISPSYEESWGIAVSEAMACGLAVVCYDLAAYNIFGNGVIKIKLGDKDAMTKAITSLLADNSKLDAFAANARKISFSLLNWDNISIMELKEINNILSH
jgi:glycosyltransferase involved in cell wall biosynthesis